MLPWFIQGVFALKRKKNKKVPPQINKGFIREHLILLPTQELTQGLLYIAEIYIGDYLFY